MFIYSLGCFILLVYLLNHISCYVVTSSWTQNRGDVAKISCWLGICWFGGILVKVCLASVTSAFSTKSYPLNYSSLLGRPLLLLLPSWCHNGDGDFATMTLPSSPAIRSFLCSFCPRPQSSSKARANRRGCVCLMGPSSWAVGCIYDEIIDFITIFVFFIFYRCIGTR